MGIIYVATKIGAATLGRTTITIMAFIPMAYSITIPISTVSIVYT